MKKTLMHANIPKEKHKQNLVECTHPVWISCIKIDLKGLVSWNETTSDSVWLQTVYDFRHKSQTYLFVLLNTHFSTNCWKLWLILKVILSSAWWYILTLDGVKCIYNNKKKRSVSDLCLKMYAIRSRTLSEVTPLHGKLPILLKRDDKILKLINKKLLIINSNWNCMPIYMQWVYYDYTDRISGFCSEKETPHWYFKMLLGKCLCTESKWGNIDNFSEP